MSSTHPAPGGLHAPGSLVSHAAQGALWSVLTSSAARAVGLFGTLLLTRFLDPGEYGEVSLAAVVVLTASTVSSCGLSQYLVSKPDAGRAAAFHASFYFLLLGALALAVALLAGPAIGAAVHAPGLVRFLPGLAAAAALERVATIQDRIQLRDLRFTSVGVIRGASELVYSVVVVALAASGQGRSFGGGNAVVLASLARAGIRLAALSWTTPLREWLEPCRITWARTRELFSFGLPMSVATLASVGSRKWDNLVFCHHFGQGPAGIYNLAYNLADIPASQVGETIGDVLVPSFAKLEGGERRRRALLLSMRQMTLLVAPLSLGLAAVAPALAGLLDARWATIDSLLAVLCVLSVVRPIGWIGSSYLQVQNRPRTIMVLESLKPLCVVGLMHLAAVWGPRLAGPATLGPLGTGEHWAAASVGLVFALSSASYMLLFRATDGISLRAQLAGVVPPVLACAPMVVAVALAEAGLSGAGVRPLARLSLEVALGAAVFVPAAWVLAPSASRELVTLLRAAVSRRRGR